VDIPSEVIMGVDSMQPTPYPEVNEVLSALLNEILDIQGQVLLSLYAFGSLATGDFDPARSDLDLMAIGGLPRGEQFERLKQMHAEIARTYPTWNDRIEVGYIDSGDIRHFYPECTIAIISPGEPFHYREAGYGWTLNVHVVREQGVWLYGLRAKGIIDRISQEELDEAVIGLAKAWREWTDNPDPHLTHAQQVYPIMTMCRLLRAYRTGDFVAKLESARWAAAQLPVWSELILRSVEWRQSPGADYGDPDDAYLETLAFIRFVTDRIIAEAAAPPKRHEMPG
jgi:predicted nucleotidyltransferase